MLSIFVGFNTIGGGSVSVFRLYTHSITWDRLKEVVNVIREHLYDRFVQSRDQDRRISLIALEAGKHLYDVILKDGSPQTDIQFMFEDYLILCTRQNDQNFQMWFPEDGTFDLELSFFITGENSSYSEHVASHICNGVFSIGMREEGSDEILNDALLSIGIVS